MNSFKVHDWLLVLLLTMGCSIPKDSDNSLQDAKDFNLKVGVIQHPPFVVENNGQPSGSEIDLVIEFAKKENLEVDYVHGNESALVKKLEKREIHLLLGGFQQNTLWKKKAAITDAYDHQGHVLLIPKGENRLLFKLNYFIRNNETDQPI